MTQNLPPVENGYAVRPASWHDMWAVHRLERQTFTNDAYSYFDLFILFFGPGMVNLKMVDEAGKLVGFVSGGRMLGRGRTWIMTLGIHPNHQGYGLGRRLLEACEAQLRDPLIYLTVRESNDRAISLYLKTGYRQMAVKPEYYLDGETGIEMRKDRVFWSP